MGGGGGEWSRECGHSFYGAKLSGVFWGQSKVFEDLI